MYDVAVVLEGIAPILFNRYVEPPPGGGKLSEAQKQQEAEDRVYRDDDGLYLPPWNVKRVMLDGVKAAGIKRGRASALPYIAATVFVEPLPRFEGKTKYDRMMVTNVRIPPKTGAMTAKGRPLLETGWRLAFVLHVLDDDRTPDSLRTAFDAAGVYNGIGSWRPEYGSFVVADWKPTK